MKKLLLILFMVLALTQWGEAATRYFNSDSDGSATSPTTPFSDDTYLPNYSYATWTACYTASIAGDTCEASGGPTGGSGKSYAGRNSTIDKALTLRGSQIAGHSGTVTMTYNATATYTFAAKADGMVVERMTFTGSSTGTVLGIFCNNVTLQSLTLLGQGGSNTAFLRIGTGAGTITANDIIIDGTGCSASAFGIRLTAGTPTFNRLRISNMLNANYPISHEAATTVTVNYGILENCAYGVNITNAVSVLNWNNGVIPNISSRPSVRLVTGSIATFNNVVFNGIDFVDGTGGYTFQFVTGGTLNTNNCLYQGPPCYPRQFSTGTGTWNDVAPIINGFPYFKSTKAGLGFISISSDGSPVSAGNIQTIANYTMNTYGIPHTWFVSFTHQLTAPQKVILQSLYKAGHEPASHSRHHSQMAYTTGLVVTYTGANNDMAFVINADGTSLSITGTSDTHLNIDLTAAATDTLGELVAVIEAYDNFTCTLGTGVAATALSKSLKTASTALPKTVATNIPLDDDTSANNRYYKEEITNSIADLETALHEDAACAAYTCKSFAWPENSASLFSLTWIAANTSLTSVRANSGTTYTDLQKTALSHIQIYCASVPFLISNMKGADYAGLTDAQKAVRIQQAAQVIATYASQGYFITLEHGVSDVTAAEFYQFMDELQKYRSPYNIGILTSAAIANQILTSGNWTDAGSGYWDRTFTGTDDYRLLGMSPLINAGVDVGLTSDYAGRPIQLAPDIGAYEYEIRRKRVM